MNPYEPHPDSIVINFPGRDFPSLQQVFLDGNPLNQYDQLYPENIVKFVNEAHLKARHALFAFREIDNAMSLDGIFEEIGDRKNELEKVLSIPDGKNIPVVVALEHNRLHYAVETFFVYVKSSLDLLTPAICNRLALRVNLDELGTKRDEHNKVIAAGDRIERALREQAPPENQVTATRLADLIKSQREPWLNRAVGIRDMVIHRRTLKHFIWASSDPVVPPATGLHFQWWFKDELLPPLLQTMKEKFLDFLGELVPELRK